MYLNNSQNNIRNYKTIIIYFRNNSILLLIHLIRFLSIKIFMLKSSKI